MTKRVDQLVDELERKIREYVLQTMPPDPSGTPPVVRTRLECSSTPQTVWVVKSGGAAQEVRVKTGIQNDRYAELVSGDLHAGDLVAVALRSATSDHAEPPPSFAGMRH